MILYFSGSESQGKFLYDCGVRKMLSCYIIIDKKKNKMPISAENGDVEHVLDSGAFNFFTNRPALKDAEDYIDRYCEYISTYGKYYEWICELDIERYFGEKKVEEWLEKMLKYSPNVIPCWHENRGIKKWKEYCERFKYVALGGAMFKKNRFDVDTLEKMCKYAYHKGVKVHGMACGKLDILMRVPIYSVDNTTWVSAQKFGRLSIFDEKAMRMIHLHYRDVPKFKKHFEKMLNMEMLSSWEERTKFTVGQHLKFEQFITKIWEKRGVNWL